MKKYPSYDSLDYLFNSEAETLQFLTDNNMLSIIYSKPCQNCYSPFTIRPSKPKMMCCINRTCNTSFSIFKGTFFSNSHLSCNKLLRLSYLWLIKSSFESVVAFTNFAKQSISNWFSMLRELISVDLQYCGNDNVKIGGMNIVVEIDESKFGKRKYNRGHHVEGVWIVGGVERTDDRKLFAVSVPNRNAQTLAAVIANNVLHGSIVCTDLWKGYRDEDLAPLGLTHETVNHSLWYVDPVTGVHTNTIEGTWRAIKYEIPPKNRTLVFIDNHLFEFVWRRLNQNHLWTSLLTAIKRVVYIEY
jgi:hypothetical protein